MAGENASALRAFTRDLRVTVARLRTDDLLEFQRRLTLEAFRRIVEKTPVDTGHARSSWQVTIGAPLEFDEAAGRPPEGGGVVGPPDIGRAVAALAALGPFQVSYVSNPVPYVEILEEGLFEPPDPGPSSDPRPTRHGRILVQGGYSTQAPQGMVAVTLLELSQIRQA